MNRFNVLDRHLDLGHSYLLEASAGTGKTYSIENIVVRLLLENQDPLSIDKILVVTFTRAATAELKQRIRHTIHKTLHCFSRKYSQPPDFVQAILEKGEEEIAAAKRALERALFCFDQAQIFTIHGFCSRMLRENGFEGDLGFDPPSDKDRIALSKVLGVIRDYFRTEIRPDKFSQAQLQSLLKKFSNNQEELENNLCKLLLSGQEISPTPDFNTQLHSFQLAIQSLRQKGYVSSKLILEDFHRLAASYKLHNKQKEIKPEFLSQAESLAQLFDQTEWSTADFDQLIQDKLSLLDSFDDSNLRAKATPPAASSLHYPDLWDQLRRHLKPIVETASNPLSNYARLAADCQKHFRRYCAEEEMAIPDDLLKAMFQGVQNAPFANRVRAQYRAAIIDEFQDTDPVQWGIFKTLFSHQPRCRLYLVGDPKQSIYAFRQADIYTYLDAAKTIDLQASLDTNYRSQQSLVAALNTLFCHENTPGLIPLPRLNQELPYQPVKASSKTEQKSFSDSLGAIHFCIAQGEQGKSKKWPTELMEEASFFPFIVQEIQRLTKVDHLSYPQFAILVRDRFQAERLANHLATWKIPTMTQQSGNLADTAALPLMKSCLQATLYPRDMSAIKTALGGRLIGWTHEQIRDNSSPAMEKAIAQFYTLRRELFKSFITFFQTLMQSWWQDEKNVTDKLLAEQDGIELYQDLQQIAEILAEQQSQMHATPEALLQYLESFLELKDNQDARLNRRQDPTRQAVQIMTLHMSKGLEFEIVFALGLVNRTIERDELIRVTDQEKTVLAAIIDENDPSYLLYQQENDAEKLRQLYVAMTRAKHRLYLPVAISEDKSSLPVGTASPMDLLLARLNGGNSLTAFIDSVKDQVQITYSTLNPSSFSLSVQTDDPSLSLLPPSICPTIPGQLTVIYSFSSLLREEHSDPIDSLPPHDYRTEHKTIHTLPAGADTGNLLHQIFETIDFGRFKEMSSAEDCIPLIRPFLLEHPLQDWITVIAEIVFNTLTLPLNTEDKSFRLCDIEKSRTFSEMEFLYPYEGVPFPLPEEIQLDHHFLKGFIDLFFMHEGKYYLLDWKSNWLGANDIDYHPATLAQAMKSHHYHLQASIYQEAAKRFIKLYDERPFDECLGGIFYLFLRGGNQGIYQLPRSNSCAD